MGANNLPLVFLNCDWGNLLEIGLLWVGRGARAFVGVEPGGIGRYRVEMLWNVECGEHGLVFWRLGCMEHLKPKNRSNFLDTGPTAF